MESKFFEIGGDGVRLTVYGAIDTTTALYLAAAIFGGMVLALAVYAKILR